MAEAVQSAELFRIVCVGDLTETLKFLNSHPDLDINICNDDGESLLIFCVKRSGKEWKLPFGGEFLSICGLLVRRNIDVDLRDQTERTAAHYAVEMGQLEILKLLIRHNACLDIARSDGLTAMDLIVQMGDADWVLAICETFAYIDVSKRAGRGEKAMRHLFHRFLSSKHQSCIWHMCEAYPRLVGATDEESLTALHVAVIENKVNTVNILLGFEANTEAVDNKGHTALHFAAVYRNLECLLALLNSGANVNSQDVSGATPLHYAVSTASEGSNRDHDCLKDSLVKHLLNNNASVTLGDNDGRSPLHWAANAGNANICKVLVSRGCPVNTACNTGLTALHMAASQGHGECIRVLVRDCLADVNKQDKCGHTALFNAIASAHVDCGELLLRVGASPNTFNFEGDSPAHFAARKGLAAALEIIHIYKGSLELENSEGDRPVHEAALFQQLDAVDYMLKCGCEVNVRNTRGLTPLHLSASVGSKAVCDRLMAGGAAINTVQIQCKNGIYKFLTPLDLTELNSHRNCLNLLKSKGGVCGEKFAARAVSKIQRCWRKRQVAHKSSEYVEERPYQEPSPLSATQDEKGRVEEDNQDEDDCTEIKEKHVKRHEELSASDKSDEPKQDMNKFRMEHDKTSCINSLEAAKDSSKPENEATTEQLESQINVVRQTNKEKRSHRHSRNVKQRSQDCKRQLQDERSSKSKQLSQITSPGRSRRKPEHDQQKAAKNLKDSLEVEISRTEKLSKEIATLKKSLYERTHSLDERLKEIERRLR